MRLSQSKLILKDVERATPLAFPLFVDRTRDRVSSEKLADRVRKMQAQLECAASEQVSRTHRSRYHEIEVSGAEATMEGSLSIELEGERLLLLPQRALFWPDHSTLLVADLHLGKAATFRAAGIPAPEGTTAATLGRLSTVVRLTKAQCLIVLGDLVHAAEGLTEQVCETMARWRAAHAHLALTLVTGNHDRRAGQLPENWQLQSAGLQLEARPFLLLHHPEPVAGAYFLAGHVHPAIRLQGVGRQRLKLPCFWFGGEGGILPAFGAFTGNHLLKPKMGEQVYAVAEDVVIPIHPAETSQRDWG